MALTISATDSEVQKPVNVYYERLWLENQAPVCPYFAGTKKGRLEKKAGTATVNFRRFDEINPGASGTAAPSALSELTGNATYMQSRNSSALSMTDVTATVSKYGQFVILNEEVNLFIPNEMGSKVVMELGRAAGKGLNRLQRDIAEDNLTKVYAGGAASDGAVTSAITMTEIRKVINTLVTNNARDFTPMTAGSDRVGSTPLLPGFWAITHPDAAADIEQISGFKGVETYAGHVDTVPGEFGALQGAGFAVRFIQTPESTVDAAAGGTVGSTGLAGSSGVDLYNTVIYGQDALGSLGLGLEHTDGIYRAGEGGIQGVELIEKPLGSGGTSDPYNEISTLAWKAFHGGALLNSAWGRVVRHGATDLS